MAGTIAEHQREVSQAQAAGRRQDRLAEERLLRAEQQIAHMALARQELDSKVCTPEKKQNAAKYFSVFLLMFSRIALLKNTQLY